MPQFVVKFGVEIVLPTNRRRQHTLVDSLTLIGIFVGLFAGFSVISAFETLYYLLIEPFKGWYQLRMSSRVHPMMVVRDLKKLKSGFFSSSSIHGFNHIGNRKKSTVERFESMVTI
jgi:hypothetical protein